MIKVELSLKAQICSSNLKRPEEQQMEPNTAARSQWKMAEKGPARFIIRRCLKERG